MVEKSLEQILERWREAFDQYDKLKSMAEPAIVKWEWAVGERYSVRPFYFQRFPGRARALKSPPVSKHQHTEYGLDEQNRPRLYRVYDHLERPFETFYNYNETLVEIIGFSIPPHVPLKVEQIFYEKDRVIQYVYFELNGYTPLYSTKGKDPDVLYRWLGPKGRLKTVEQYIYDSNYLTKILSYHEMPGASPFNFEEHLSYDHTGKLLRIEGFYEDGSSRVLYRKRQKNQTFNSIRKIATQKMIEAIIGRLRTENIKEKLYCIELSYRSVTNYFPPGIILGPETYRQNLLNSNNPEARYYVFTPIFHRPEQWLQITDPDALEYCGLLEQEIQAKSRWETATNILRDVAAVLTRYDWTGILDITPDFVVYAIDHEMEGDDLGNVLSASASNEQLLEWKKKGWL
jgi:hypothetical protein